MMRFLVILIFAARPAAAHPGHLAGLAGHDHWVAGVAIGVAIAIGLWAGLKGKSEEEAEADGDVDEPEAQEA